MVFRNNAQARVFWTRLGFGFSHARVAIERVSARLRLYMAALDRITHDPSVMGGKPCIRGLRVTVGNLLEPWATCLACWHPGTRAKQILELYPYLEEADIQAALAYAAWRTQETELPLP